MAHCKYLFRVNCIFSSMKLIDNSLNYVTDEQERVQKKTFTNWMNTYLKQVWNVSRPAGVKQTMNCRVLLMSTDMTETLIPLVRLIIMNSFTVYSLFAITLGVKLYVHCHHLTTHLYICTKNSRLLLMIYLIEEILSIIYRYITYQVILSYLEIHVLLV